MLGFKKAQFFRLYSHFAASIWHTGRNMIPKCHYDPGDPYILPTEPFFTSIAFLKFRDNSRGGLHVLAWYEAIKRCMVGGSPSALSCQPTMALLLQKLSTSVLLVSILANPVIADVEKCGQIKDNHVLISQRVVQSEALGRKKKLTKSSISVDIGAPRQIVWQKLIDFNRYAEIFKRLKSCKVTRTEGNLVYTESLLKSHFFVRQPCQHTVNDLSGKPSQLTWRMIDGNFKSVEGTWKLASTNNDNHCRLTYILEVEAGPVIPGPLVCIILRMVQKEVAASIKSACEADFVAERAKLLVKEPS